MSRKKELGQYFTTNYNYILDGFYIPDDIEKVVEPFAGNGDLLDFIKKDSIIIECYDIEPKQCFITKRDTLNFPVDFKDKFILTNPPYLARNKTKNKELFDMYKTNDLYKCFIIQLLTNCCKGGIVIIPLNFWSSIRKSDIDLRKKFLNVYKVIRLNIFEEKVFNDTSYTVCSFQFERNFSNTEQPFKTVFYPSKNISMVKLTDYIIGGEIYNLPQSNYAISRYTDKSKETPTKLVIKCIDDNKNNMISLLIKENSEKYIDNTPNHTARTYATIIISPEIDISTQQLLSVKFNQYLYENRVKYNSLFLTNYRESKDISRKRISFDLVYKIISYLLI